MKTLTDQLPGTRGHIRGSRESAALGTIRIVRAALVAVAIALGATTSTAQARLIRDVNRRPLGTASAEVRHMVTLGNLVICATDHGAYTAGGRLFAVDWAAGTATELLSSQFDQYRDLTRVGNAVYFIGNGGALWSTDGTVAGTSRRGIGGVSLTAAGPRLFLRMYGTSAELGVFDTSTGRYTFIDIRPGLASANPGHFTALGNTLYFSADTDGAGRELWKSDGTIAGTVQVHEFSPGPASTEIHHVVAKDRGAAQPPYLVVSATPDGGVRQLWRVDERPSGVRLLGDLVVNQVFDDVATTRFFFAGRHLSGSYGEELYVSDGTAAGTRMVADIAPGASHSSSPRFVGAFGGRVYFGATDSVHGRELWCSDGTAAGTVMVRDIRAGGESAGPGRGAVIGVGGRPALVFPADDGVVGEEPWITDGTPAGTRRLADGYPGLTGSAPGPALAVSVDTAIFAATDRLLGRELWITSGSGATTRLLLDLVTIPGGPVTDDSNPALGVRYGLHVLFAAEEQNSGVELWQTDGWTRTQLRADLVAGTPSSSPRDFTIVGDELFFTASDAGGVRRLWVMRWSSAPPTIVSSAAIDPSDLCAVDEVLFFKNQDPATGAELWKSDGTSAGTVLVRDLVRGSGSSDPHGIVAFRGRAYFVATHPNFGTELWTSDGTAAGTLFVRDIVQGSVSSGPQELTVVGDTLFFTATSSGVGRELWRSGGTTGTTVLAVDIRPGLRGSDPTELTKVGERLFFMADDGSRGREVWVSDGTAAGTHIVRDVWPGSTRGALGSLLAGGDLLYFQAMDAAGGPEPWRSDGTQAGTFALGDLQPGVGGSYPEFQAASGSRFVWFSARTADAGRELWRSDGTAAGTSRVTDILPGGDSSDPEVLGVLGHRLVFAANDPLKGREPFATEAGATTLSYGYGCGFNRVAPRLTVDDLVLDDFATIRMEGVRSGSFALFGLSALPLAQPIRMQTGCWLYPDAGSVAMWGPYQPTAGTFQLTVLVPNVPILQDREMVWQGIVAPSPSPLGFDTSQGVVTTCGN